MLLETAQRSSALASDSNSSYEKLMYRIGKLPIKRVSGALLAFLDGRR
jgi:hypothetical protein